MRWKRYDEAIELLERRFQYFPQTFRWRGRRYEVDAVNRCWTTARSGWRRRVERRLFLVECAEGTFELYQDLRANTWHLRRARRQDVWRLPGKKKAASPGNGASRSELACAAGRAPG
jgi:hypothetical protein